MIKSNEIINLDTLLEFSMKLNERPDPEFIFNSTLLTLIGKLAITKAAIFNISNDPYYLEAHKGKEITREGLDNPEYHKKEIEVNEDLKLLIVLGKKINGKNFSNAEKKYINLITSIARSALQNCIFIDRIKEEKTNVEKKNQLLETLFELSNNFSGIVDEKSILKTLSLNLMGQLLTSKYAVIRKQSDQLIIVRNTFPIDLNYDFLKSLNGIEKTSINEGEFPEQIKIITPMQIGGRINGYLLVGDKMNGADFNKEELEFVSSIANSAISALENERLFFEEVEKKKIESELSIALDIQQKLLPKPDEFKAEKIEVDAFAKPSGLVGGDYYDFVKISDTKYQFIIADVSGKGMPASLLMSNLQAVIRSLSNFDLPLTELVNKINQIIFENTTIDKYITMFILNIDTQKNEVEYVNAGHFSPITFIDGKLTELKTGGLILGFMESPLEYHSDKFEFQSPILLFTDGLNEAKNKKGEYLGFEKVKEIFVKNKEKSSKEILEEMKNLFISHSSDIQQYDDITIMCIAPK